MRELQKMEDRDRMEGAMLSLMMGTGIAALIMFYYLARSGAV